MAREIVRYLLIISGLLLLAASTSRTFMQWVSDKRNENESWWGVHKPTEGDLVGMAYLDKVTKFHSLRDYAFTRHPVETGTVDLYVWGDSYLWKIPDTAFAGTSNFKFGWRYRDDIRYNLDSTQVNVLLIEIAERYVRPYFSGTDIFNHVLKEEKNATSLRTIYKNYAMVSLPAIENLFNPLINQNLEYNLFNYNFINPVRQWKASMNYHLFTRASGDVVISEDKNQLFLKETVQGKRLENSYYPIAEAEAEHIISTLNIIAEHYKTEGFDEVYLSMIPNPATILQPEGYNQLIPRIESHPNLKIKVISVYSLFQNANRRLYRPGDTHWNNEGAQIWLKEVNKVLLRHN